MSGLVDGLGVLGRLIVIGASTEPIEVSPAQLITGNRSIHGWTAGTSIASEDAHSASRRMARVRPLIETYPLAKAAEAYDRMTSGKARFRVVLKMNSVFLGRCRALLTALCRRLFARRNRGAQRGSAGRTFRTIDEALRARQGAAGPLR